MSLDASKKLIPVTGVILAGGQSRRMGENKALMELGDDSLIGHVIRCMQNVTDERLLITNSPTEYGHLGVPMHGDILPGTGALGGLYTGLTHASHDAVLCAACDSPFLNPKLLTYLVSVLGEYDAVIPETFAHHEDTTQITLQTLCAVYSKRCLPIIESMLRESELRVHALQERAHIKRISPEIWQEFDPDGMSFFNINTPQDFETGEKLILSKRHNIISG